MAFSTSTMPAPANARVRSRHQARVLQRQLRRVKYTPMAVVEEQVGTNSVKGAKPRPKWQAKPLDIADIRPDDGFDFYHGHTFFATSSPDLASQVTRYGEMCQMTYSSYLPLDASIPPYAPTEDVYKRVQGVKALNDQGIGELREQRACATTEDRLLAPHPIGEVSQPTWCTKNGVLCYEWKDVPAGYGFVEPDSPLLAAGYKVTHSLSGVAAILDRGTDMKKDRNWIGYIAVSEELKEVAIVFRGTILNTEWSQNADCRAYVIKSVMPGSTNFASTDKPETVLAHNGFGEVYYYVLKPSETNDKADLDVDPELRGDKSLAEQVIAGLAQLANPKSKKYLGWTPNKITITGHSLGGALATMSAFDLAHAVEQVPDDPEVATWEKSTVAVNRRAYYAHVVKTHWPEVSQPGVIQGVTWAQPRVGNEEYYKEFHRLIPKGSWLRLVNKGDLVPTVPKDDLSIVPELGDLFFYWNYYCKKEIKWGSWEAWKSNPIATLFSPLKPISLVVSEIVQDIYENDNMKATYKHVGWELEFDPSDSQRFPYLFMGLKSQEEVQQQGTLTLPFVGTIMTDLKSLAGRRHNLEVMMHMVDPTLDKARLNKTDNTILHYKKLKANPDFVSGNFEEKYGEIYERLGKEPPACWWWPYTHTVTEKDKQDKDRQFKVGVKQMADGTYKWSRL